MTNCIQTTLEFPALKSKKVQAEFSGGDITAIRTPILKLTTDCFKRSVWVSERQPDKG